MVRKLKKWATHIPQKSHTGLTFNVSLTESIIPSSSLGLLSLTLWIAFPISCPQARNLCFTLKCSFFLKPSHQQTLFLQQKKLNPDLETGPTSHVPCHCCVGAWAVPVGDSPAASCLTPLSSRSHHSMAADTENQPSFSRVMHVLLFQMEKTDINKAISTREWEILSATKSVRTFCFVLSLSNKHLYLIAEENLSFVS